MASTEATPGSDAADLKQAINALIESYKEMGMPVRRYVFIVLLPAIAFFFVSIVLSIALPLPLTVRVPIPLLGLLIGAAAVFYPKIVADQRRREIENKLPLLITHMTVLSTTNIDRMEVFRTLAKEEEYDAAADEINYIVTLVDSWNQSLDDACRRRAKRTPSEAFSDFLERIAYSLGAGQELKDFLLNEQEVIINNYKTVYEGSLNNLDVMKDLYLSMVLSLTFGLVFAIVLPILTGTSPTGSVGAVIGLFILIQLGFFMAIRTVAPTDPIWYVPEEMKTDAERKSNLSLAAGVGLVVLVSLFTMGGLFGILPIGLEEVLFFLDDVPLQLYIAIPLTPLIIPGLVLRGEENDIKARDQEFPSFIRALGSTESAKQGTTSGVLESLRRKDFGKLSENVNNLYKRLNMRIETEEAWRHFTAECHSYLIQKFSEMYLIGRQMGGDPKQLGELISENMSEVLQLRERRQQETITLIGLLYGITAASTFAFFIGLKVVKILSNMSLNLDTSQFDFGSIINASVYNIPEIEYLLMIVIMFNALLSSLMIRTVDGGHKANSYFHFVMLIWLGLGISILTQVLVGAILTI
ncbi:MAG: archaellar assembly protein FlaJ [Halobacteriales archaeon]